LVTEVTSKRRVSDIMSAMSEGRVRPLFDAMAEDVTWRWMGVKQWTRSFNGKQTMASMPDCEQDADLPIRIPAHRPGMLH
jgi:hypothetical protein